MQGAIYRTASARDAERKAAAQRGPVAPESVQVVRAQTQGDMDLQNQAYQNKLGVMKNVFGGRNPYSAINSFASSGLGQFGGDVYSPQQQQQLINQGVALNNQQLASGLQEMRGGLAGKGFSSNSPLWQALMSGRQAATAASNADVRRQVPLEIAQSNASHRLNSALGAEEIRSKRFNDQTSLLSSILGLF